MPSSYSRQFLFVMLVVCSVFAVADASAAETDPDGRLYQPSARHIQSD